MTEARIASYRNRVAGAAADKTRVHSSITTLCAEIRALWDELLVPVESCSAKIDQWILGKIQVRFVGAKLNTHKHVRKTDAGP